MASATPATHVPDGTYCTCLEAAGTGPDHVTQDIYGNTFAKMRDLADGASVVELS